MGSRRLLLIFHKHFGEKVDMQIRPKNEIQMSERAPAVALKVVRSALCFSSGFASQS